MFCPSHTILPPRIGWWPTMARSSEGLPTPLRPSTQVTRPVRAVSDTERSACAAPQKRSTDSTLSIPLPSQIDFNHPRIGADRIDRTFGEHRAFVQDGHLDPELAHEIHVVLDHNY